MKNFYLLLIVSIITSGIGFGQNIAPGNTSFTGKKLEKNIQLNSAKKYRFQPAVGGSRTPIAESRTSINKWVSYAGAMAQFATENGTPSEINGNYLFPDSTNFALFDTDYGNPWVHTIGDVLDVTSSYIKTYDTAYLDKTIPYTLDSMAIDYSYNRIAGSTTVDTILVTLYTNSTAANLPTYLFTGFAANYGSDTLCFKAQKYTYTTNKPNATGSVTIKVPLDWADTSTTTLAEKVFSTNTMAVAAGKLVAVGVTYKPGGTFAATDTLDKQINSFTFASYEENGAGAGTPPPGSYPTYTYCPPLNVGSAACDWNASSLVTNAVRYNLDPSPGWNGFYTPAYAYTAPFGFEHHLFSYNLTYTSTVGINEADNNDYSLTQNQPNPFHNQTTINYQINKTAGNVTLQIFDIRGVKLYEKTELNVKSGNHSVAINNVGFLPGVYFYSLNIDGAIVTKKMIAQ